MPAPGWRPPSSASLHVDELDALRTSAAPTSPPPRCREHALRSAVRGTGAGTGAGTASPLRRRRPPAVQARTVLTVSELTGALRELLETTFPEIWVEGELSNAKVWTTGHLYFTLKDGGAQIKGVMFRSALRYLKFKPEDGLHVVVRGRISVYDPKGEYQLVGEHMEPHGFGALQLAFEQLKKKLAAEGLFEPARKRPLPGAAPPHRHRHVDRRRGAARHRPRAAPPLSERAPGHRAVARAGRGRGRRDRARAPADRRASRASTSSSSARGGGSLEDLWAFNEEKVARAIAASPVPVISARRPRNRCHHRRFRRRPARADAVGGRRARRAARRTSSTVTSIGSASASTPRDPRRACGGSNRASTRWWRGRASRAFAAGSRCADGTSSELAGGAAARARRIARPARAAARAAASRARRSSIRGIGSAPSAPGWSRAKAHSAKRSRAACTTPSRASRRLAARLDGLSPLAVLGRGYAVCWDESRTRILRDAATVTVGETSASRSNDGVASSDWIARRVDAMPRVRGQRAGDQTASHRATRAGHVTSHDGHTIKDFEAAIAELETHRQEARRGRPAAREVARAVRARRAAVALLPRAARRSRAAHRDPQRARRAEAGAAVARTPRRRGSLSVTALDEYLARPAPRNRGGARTVSSRAARLSRRCVAEAMRYSLMAGGKRLRPDADAGRRRGDRARARRVARPARGAGAAGRLRDRDDPHLLAHSRRPARRWTTTCCGAAGRRCTSCRGDGMAILAGDGLQAEAFALLAREPVTSDPAIDVAQAPRDRPHRRSRRAGRHGRRTGHRSRGGAPRARTPAPPPLDAAGLEGMHARKTGALIRASAVVRRHHGRRRRRRESTAIDRYAREIGLAFQIVDDILDVEGASAALGKTAGKDAAAGKPTYPALFGLERSRELADACLARAHEALADRQISAARASATSPTGSCAGTRDHAARPRLDTLLVARGLVESREKARALILAGQVEVVAGTPAPRPARSLAGRRRDPGRAAGASVGRPRRHQARARARRVSASTSPAGSASTSAPRPAASPTCCCSAARGTCIALDVGHGQLHWKLRSDPRVTVVEGLNARALQPRAICPISATAPTSSPSTSRSSR